MFDDQQFELDNGRKAYDYILGKDQNEKYGKMDGHTCFVIDWVSENLPLENNKRTAFPEFVKKQIADACNQACPELEAPEIEKMDILVFADQGGLCSRIMENAPEGLVGNKRVVTKPAHMLTEEDADSLLSKQWDLVIFGGALDPPKDNTVASIIAQQSGIVKFLLTFCKKSYLKDNSVKRFVALTHDTFSEQIDTHKERGLSITTNSTMYGFCNTLRAEVEFPVHMIDIEDPGEPEILPYIVDEIFRDCTFGIGTCRLCYPWPIKNGIRHNGPCGRYIVKQHMSSEYEKANVDFECPAEGVVCISGGNGALGLVMGRWVLRWAKKRMEETGGAYKPNFRMEFLSRSAKISDLNQVLWEDVQNIASELGLVVNQGKIDMGSQSAVDAYISSVTPNLIGFIHSAGILQDSMLPNQTWEKFEAVYDSKHRAALYVHDSLERLKQTDFKFFWLFSSTSVYGNMGQLNYSSSNSYMDGLARHRLAMGKPCCAMQWGAWGEVGMAATMDDAMRRRVMMGPMPYFQVVQGLDGLERGLRTGLPGFSVFIVNPPMMFGMVGGDQNKMGVHTQNFYGPYVPHGAPSSYDASMVYNIYKMYKYIFAPESEGERLILKNYITARLKDTDDSDDRIEVGGYGGF